MFFSKLDQSSSSVRPKRSVFSLGPSRNHHLQNFKSSKNFFMFAQQYNRILLLNPNPEDDKHQRQYLALVHLKRFLYVQMMVLMIEYQFRSKPMANQRHPQNKSFLCISFFSKQKLTSNIFFCFRQKYIKAKLVDVCIDFYLHLPTYEQKRFTSRTINNISKYTHFARQSSRRKERN